MNVGERIKACRTNAGMSAEELGEKIGKAKTTIYRYESGYIDKVPFKILEPLAKALRTTPAYLMGWTDEQSSVAAEMSEIETEILRLCSTMTTRQKTLLLAKAYEIIDKTEETK